MLCLIQQRHLGSVWLQLWPPARMLLELYIQMTRVQVRTYRGKKSVIQELHLPKT